MEITPGKKVKLKTKKGNFDCIILESPRTDIILIKLSSASFLIVGLADIPLFLAPEVSLVLDVVFKLIISSLFKISFIGIA